MGGEVLKKIGTLGGAIHVRKDMKGYYFGESQPGGNFSKEKLFGQKGPLHPGMPVEHQIAAGASSSDTRATLIRELVEQSHFSRREAEDIVSDMLANGTLQEVDDKILGKVLVFRGR